MQNTGIFEECRGVGGVVRERATTNRLFPSRPPTPLDTFYIPPTFYTAYNKPCIYTIYMIHVFSSYICVFALYIRVFTLYIHENTYDSYTNTPLAP